MKKISIRALIPVAFIVGVVWISQKVEFSVLQASAQERYSELQSFSKVLNLIQTYYVEPVDTKKLVYGAIKGMLRELDPHTNFMPPEMFKDFENETSGEFGGLGVEISLQNGILTVISPIDDTPAFLAGIQAGDKIIAIDGKSTKGINLIEASQMMKGKLGAAIKLSIVRDTETEPRDFTIVRSKIKIKSAKYTDLTEGYGYVRIASFIENTAKDLEKILADHAKKYPDNKGFIIDLRRNPGGLLDQAIKVSDLFLKDGIIVSTIGRDQSQKEVSRASKNGKYTQVPIIVLINEYSASASEIVAGALQDNKRAVIMGEKSFGKGSVQNIIKMPDGSGLKLTIARYYTPSGKSIQSVGIEPDVELKEFDPEVLAQAVSKQKGVREKDIAGHLLSEKEKQEKAASKTLNADTEPVIDTWWASSQENQKNLKPHEKLLAGDYQLYQAVNYLKAWKVMKGVNF